MEVNLINYYLGLLKDSTEPSKSTHPKWDETGESFIRELDWSRCILKLNVADKDTREEVYAEYTCDLKAFMNDCLVSLLGPPSMFTTTSFSQLVLGFLDYRTALMISSYKIWKVVIEVQSPFNAVTYPFQSLLSLEKVSTVS